MSVSVSVVVTCFESTPLLLESLASATAQTHPVREIILVDDGSSDPSASLIREAVLKTPGARLHRQENMGLPGARNAGAKLSTGDYLAFLDHDDIWEPDYLEKLIPVLQADTSLAVVFCRIRHILSDGRKTERTSKPKLRGLGIEDLLLTDPASCGSSFVIRREAFEGIGGFDPKFLRAETPEIFIRFLAAGWEVRGVDSVLVNYRNTPSSLASGKLLVRYRRQLLARTAKERKLHSGVKLRILLEFNQLKIQLRRWLLRSV